MDFIFTHITETDSTNRWLSEHGGKGDQIVWADYQTAGRGCGTNRWESAEGENLLFSMLVHHRELTAIRQWQVSMAAAVAIAKVAEKTIGDKQAVSIKWPNDIYWLDSKLAGILIEHRIKGTFVNESIIGVGLNVNQARFVSDAPNPVSLFNITGNHHDREQLLRDIAQAFTPDISPEEYHSRLYRREGIHPYRDAKGEFRASIVAVEPDGQLMLRDTDNHERRYGFKEVSFVI